MIWQVIMAYLQYASMEFLHAHTCRFLCNKSVNNNETGHIHLQDHYRMAVYTFVIKLKGFDNYITNTIFN